jgi:RNA polymerase sigma-70 factor, ECF subfamily
LASHSVVEQKRFNRRPGLPHSRAVTGEPRTDQAAPGHAIALIEGCRRGERAALSAVFRVEVPYLERVLSRLVSSSADLEDLVQLSVEHAIKAFPAFRGEASVRTWLTRIAVRTAMHHLKHPSRKRRVAFEVIEGGQNDLAPSRPQHEAEARARLRLLCEHLDTLDPKHHMAFVLFQVEGRAMEEVAALMDSNVSTTKSRVMYARRKLFARLAKDPRTRGWLEEYGVGEET